LKLDRRTGFVSDVHLRADDPAGLRQFCQALKDSSGHLSSLVILGDLFDAWVGDDLVNTDFCQPVISALKALNCPISFLVGNRDFLLGRPHLTLDWCKAVNADRLAEQTIAQWNDGTRDYSVLLAHGDQWCTDDLPYQSFRAQVREPSWQTQFLSQPMATRLSIAQHLRGESETAKQSKSMQIMDVNFQAIQYAFEHTGCDLIVHGHTHRPAVHKHQLKDGTTRTRIVLPDWDAALGRGAIMQIRTLNHDQMPQGSAIDQLAEGWRIQWSAIAVDTSASAN
jgi:UDP-2,3-diacylglucosamine hydrolase